MSLNSTAKSARRQSFGVTCTVQDAQETLYTCPANCRAEIEMLYIVNAKGNTTVNSTWNDLSSSTGYRILGNKNMASGEAMLLKGAVLVLEAGDTITITPSSNAAPNLHGMCTVVETFVPVG